MHQDANIGVPALQYIAMMASNISTEPRKVYRKNLKLA